MNKAINQNIKKTNAKIKNKVTNPISPIPPVVGIGASAGGQNVIKSLIQDLPNDTGMAFVVIQHLSEDYPSQAEEVYGSNSSMQIHICEEHMKLEANHIYFIPNNADLDLKDGFFNLISREKSPASLHLPIDLFFTSMSHECGARCVGIILTGTGSDGANGMHELANSKAVTIIQDPTTAQYNSMPLASLNQSDINFVLPIDQIAQKIISISKSFMKNIPYQEKHDPGDVEIINKDDEQNFELIIQKIRKEEGINFSDYKDSTLKRRLKRRMDFCKTKSFKDYLDYIEKTPNELHLLYDDITINVTQFFRNPEIFEFLKLNILKKLIEGHDHKNPIRIWVPGCSTGEEAYSFAIILLEILGEKASQIPFQIFATDISEQVLEKGRKGIYTNEILTNVTDERISRFFTKSDETYQINKSIRDCCLFAKHDVTTDPPFSRIDLISCRNLLIYLNPSLQKRVIDIFSYSLNLNGILVLGNSESNVSTQGVLECVDKKHKIHVKTLSTVKLPLQSSPLRPRVIKNNTSRMPITPLAYDFKAEVDRIYSEKFGHAGFLINDNMEILQLYGNVTPFLSFTSGEATLNISKIISKNLLLELRSILLTVKKNKKAIVKRGFQFKDKRKTKTYNIDVVPLISPNQTTYYSIFFTDISVATKAIGQNSELWPKPSKKIKKKVSTKEKSTKKESILLALELDETRKLLQTIIEEQDLTNNELQVLNEELMSSNEELQSSNEELQTAQEELQSTNEELRTLNEELNYRNKELDSLSGDLSNILNSVATPILIISGDYTIRRFTPAAQEIFNFIPGDIGRSFTNIKHNLKIDNLEELITQSIQNNSTIQRDLQDHKNTWYSLNIKPYRTPDNRIDGVVCVLFDINNAKNLSEKIELERNIAEAVVDSVENPLLVLDENLKVKSANEAFYKTFKVDPRDTINFKVYEIDKKKWDIEPLRKFIDMLTSGVHFHDFKFTHTFAKIGSKVIHLSGAQVSKKDINNNEVFFKIYLLSIEDITNQVRDLNDEKKARRIAENHQDILNTARKSAEDISKDLVEEKKLRLGFITTLSHDLLTPLTVARMSSEILARKSKENEVIQKSSKMINKNIDRVTDMLKELLNTTKLDEDNFLHIQKCNISAIIEKGLSDLTVIHGNRFEYNQPPPIEGEWDEDALLRVLDNLCSNAVKYGNSEPIKITLALKQNSVLLTIHNEGSVITPEDQEKLFKLFHRSDEAKNGPNNGWGVGLACVDNIILAHKGNIRIDSRVNFGTSFIITLPLEH